MATIMFAGNTFNGCLSVIRKRGYHIWADEGDNSLFWMARKDDRVFASYSPPELLGLITMWEHLGESWRSMPDLTREVLAAEPGSG